MNETISPGKGIGKLRLGMSVGAAIKLRGKPQNTEKVGLSTSSKPKPTPTAYTELLWWDGGTSDEPETWLVAHVLRGVIVQLSGMGEHFRLPHGLSTKSNFTAIRRAFPKLTVHCGYFGSEDEPGYVGYFFDEVRQGVAFTLGTQDDTATYQMLPTTVPESIVVHPAGKPVLLLENGLQGLPERPLGKTSRAIAAWFAGRKTG